MREVTPEGPPLSQHLRLRVSYNGATRVDLTFPAAAAASLHELMPDDLRRRVVERGIDAAAIAAEAAQRRFAPGELCRIEEGEKTVRIWLE